MREVSSDGLAAVVLAGGASSRMGRDKAFLPWAGRPLLQRQIELARTVTAGMVWISGRAGVDYAEFGCPVLMDTVANAGPLAGMAAGLRAVAGQYEWLLVLAVDLPRMTPDYLLALRTRVFSEKRGMIPQSGPNFEPLAAIYPVLAALAMAEAQLAASQFALQKLAATLVTQGQASPVPVVEAERALFTNWNNLTDNPAA